MKHPERKGPHNKCTVSKLRTQFDKANKEDARYILEDERRHGGCLLVLQWCALVLDAEIPVEEW